jgi:hypothetical protein
MFEGFYSQEKMKISVWIFIFAYSSFSTSIAAPHSRYFVLRDDAIGWEEAHSRNTGNGLVNPFVLILECFIDQLLLNVRDEVV